MQDKKNTMESARHLVRLTYYSQTPDGIDDAALANIMEAAHRRNSRDHITGVLYRFPLGFVQILEGDRIPVSQCYTRIAADNRHQNLVIMGCSTIQSRAFPDFPMRLIYEDDSIRTHFPDAALSKSLQPWTYSEPVLAKALREVMRYYPAAAQ